MCQWIVMILSHGCFNETDSSAVTFRLQREDDSLTRGNPIDGRLVPCGSLQHLHIKS